MINAFVNIVTLITKLIAKAQTDPDVLALVTALEALVAQHNATPLKPPTA